MQKTSPGKVGQLAESLYLQMFGDINISKADITQLYTTTPGLPRGNVKVFLQIGCNGVNIGRIEIQLRYDVVPKYVNPIKTSVRVRVILFLFLELVKTSDVFVLEREDLV